MAERPPDADEQTRADNGGSGGPGPAADSTTGTPRWVIVFGVVAVLLVVLFVVLHLAGGGFRGHAAP